MPPCVRLINAQLGIAAVPRTGGRFEQEAHPTGNPCSTSGGNILGRSQGLDPFAETALLRVETTPKKELIFATRQFVVALHLQLIQLAD